MYGRLGILLLWLLPVGLLDASGPPDDSSCATVERCVEKLKLVAQTSDPEGHRLTPRDSAFIEEMLILGDEIVPPLVRLLSHPDSRVANLAAAVLRGAPVIDPVHLPAIRAGLDRELGWLAPALGRMGDAEAAREAVARLLASKSSNNQESYAVRLCGALAIPYIVEAAQCTDGCSAQDHSVLAGALSNMGPERAAATDGLLEIVGRSSADDKVVVGVLRMIGALGTDGAAAEAQLLYLRQRRAALALQIDQTLIDIGSGAAAQIFIERLRRAPDKLVLRDLAETGTAGRAAGPLLVELLDSSDWDLRLGAARALGFIGYEEAAESLLSLLDDPADVRLHWVVVQSLGRLRAQSAASRLRELARSYWYPPVRAAAEEALRHMSDNTDYARRFHVSNFAFEFFAYRSMGIDSSNCKYDSLVRRHEPRNQKLYWREGREALQALAYQTSETTRWKPQEDADDSDTTVTKITTADGEQYRTVTRHTPTLALRVTDGWMAGSNRGEWGGELVFVADNGGQVELIDDNIEDIYELGGHIIALTGLAHMGLNHGLVYQLIRDGDGVWTARRWRSLPGAPSESALLASGDLLVRTYNGGDVLLNADGEMRMAPCDSR